MIKQKIDPLNDIVFTPDYVANLMSELLNLDDKSFVLDPCCGSGILLEACHKKMVKLNIEPKNKLLGIELRNEIKQLANKETQEFIINDDALNFDYSKFFFNRVILNPPYSAPGKGFIFVDHILNFMQEGFICCLIQENAGSGKGLPYTQNILKKCTLKASIKTSDIFKNYASVQTCIYLFEVGKPHKKTDKVIFIDMSNDGYKRTSRKKDKHLNIKNVDNAEERYNDVLDIIKKTK